MLQNLDRLGKDFQKRFKAIQIWPELKISESDRLKLQQIRNVKAVNDHSLQFEISPEVHCIIPSQYLLYSVLIKEFALRLKEYTDLIEVIKKSHDKKEAWDLINQGDSSAIKELQQLDDYSKSIALKPFNRSAPLLNAKNLLNEGVIRASSDFFNSVILKVVNVPDASSSFLGDLIFELSSQKDVYEFIERKYVNQLSFIATHSEIGEFVRSVLSFLQQYDGLKALLPYLQSNADKRFQSISKNDIKLTSIFYVSTKLATNDDLSQGGSRRFFDEPLFFKDNLYFYLSTQWTNSEDGSRLDLKKFEEFIEDLYPELYFDLSDKYYYLKAKDSSNKKINFHGGENVIFYGAPGTGKSYSVDGVINKDRSTRTIFHADFQYSDFVGCLKPINENDSVGYAFRPGPFTKALIEALNNPNEQFWLVVEEINRAPAAAVFGEIFQLLDRDESGKSRYTIYPSDHDMLTFIKSKLHIDLAGDQIYIPENLSILATMNSSDQAVMPLDTAFKRRWKFKYVPLDFANSPAGDLSFVSRNGIEQNVSWSSFAQTINQILSNLEIPEDRHLGPFFLNQEELKDTGSKIQALNGKLFMYLWDDVLRHGFRQELFRSDIKTYGNLTSEFLKKQPVFSDSFYDLLEQRLS
jgi:AAA domain (dynein-related subfamily)